MALAAKRTGPPKQSVSPHKRKGPGPAYTLLIETALKKIVHKDAVNSFKHDKATGLAPCGTHSCFGDFPPRLMHKDPWGKQGYALSKSMSTPELPSSTGGNVAGRTGFSTTGSLDSRASMGSTVSSQGSNVSPRAGFNKHVAFTVAQNTKPLALNVPSSPPKAGAADRRPIPETVFRRYYDRSDLPLQVFHGGLGGKISWKIEVEKLDYHHYLPILFDGLREKEDPYRFLAVQGTYDMLEKGGSKILPVVPQLIIPIKMALNTRDHELMTTMMKVIQALVLSAEGIGEALVPYYRQILPVFNLFKHKSINSGDLIDYGQRKRMNIGELIAETLDILESHGGEDAFINIKYMIPTYESCMSMS